MTVIDQIKARAKTHNKRVVFPEPEDPRTLKAAIYLANHQICVPVLIGNMEAILGRAGEQLTDVPASIEYIDPETSPHREMFARYFYEKRRHKGMNAEKSYQIMGNSLYYAAAMLVHDHADACIAGAVNTTGDVLRAAIQVVGMKPGSRVVSSVFLMSMPDGNSFTFGDCAVVPYPDEDQLASIAVDASRTHFQLTGEEPRTAMLSFSTKGSAEHERTVLVRNAVQKARELAPEVTIDGELQFDAALLPAIGDRKAPGSAVAGKANVFVFPNLDAGNIGYKIAERLAGATATGPIIQGLAKPMNDLSRGCSWEDIVNTAAVSILQSS